MVAASSVGKKTWMLIEPKGSETGTVKSFTEPTEGEGPGQIVKVYFVRLALYSSYVTWSARSFGARMKIRMMWREREKGGGSWVVPWYLLYIAANWGSSLSITEGWSGAA